MVLRKLERLGRGYWQQEKTTKALRMESGGPAADLELWRTRWSKGGRIVFEVTQEAVS